MTADSSEILLDGPWRHRFVAANGARFHVAEAGGGPLVILLHGFPQFWWAWRHQLPALAEAGYHAVAMDLRGYGASDKPPRGYDTLTLAADIAGVVRALGERRAVVVGHGWGGWVAWSMPAIAPRVTRAVAVLSMAHPLQMRLAFTRNGQRRTLGPLLAFQAPMAPEHWLEHGNGVERLLREWSGPRLPGRRDAVALPAGDAGPVRGAHLDGVLPLGGPLVVASRRTAVRGHCSGTGRRFRSCNCTARRIRGSARARHRSPRPSCTDDYAMNWFPVPGISCRRRHPTGSRRPCSTGCTTSPSNPLLLAAPLPFLTLPLLDSPPFFLAR